MSVPAATRLLIENATIVSMDPNIGDLRRGSILIEDGLIAGIGPAVDADDCARIDASGLIAIPGLVDAHRHVWQGALSLVAADADLNGYFGTVIGRLAPAFRPEDVQTGNLIGALQALDAGVTTLFDWSHVQHSPDHSDAAIAGLHESGARVVFGYGFPNDRPDWIFESPHAVPEDVRRVRRDLLPGDEGRITMALALRGPEMSGLEVTSNDLSVARELALRSSVHVGNGDFGKPYRAIERMELAGLLGPDLQYVHGNSLDDESIRIIAATGGQAVVTPTVELQMQFGYPATTRFLAAGVRPGIGVDVVTSSDAGLFGQMAAAFQIARHQSYEQGTPSIDTRDVLSFATIDAARSIGLDGRIGSLTPGKRADVVLLQVPPLNAVNDPVGFVVLGAGAGTVHTVIVDGEVLKRDGRLLRSDVPALEAALERSRTYIFETSGFSPPIAAFA